MWGGGVGGGMGGREDNLQNMCKLIHTYRTCSVSPASGCSAWGHGSGARLTGMQTFPNVLLWESEMLLCLFVDKY